MSALIRLRGSLPTIEPKDGHSFAPLATWIETAPAARGRSVQLAPTDDPAVLADCLGNLDAIAIEFPKPTDGRGYSIAVLVRRLGWRGELRAIGAVAQDQIAFMARCGFDAFDLRDGEDAGACVAAFGEITVRYQGAADHQLPLFRRRREALDAMS